MKKHVAAQDTYTQQENEIEDNDTTQISLTNQNNS